MNADSFKISHFPSLTDKEPWFTRQEWEHLPESYDPEYKLQAIDAEGRERNPIVDFCTDLT